MMRDTLWTALEAADATGGINSAEWTAVGVSIDSRTLDADDLFIALQGPNFDGHDYIGAAFAAGAAAAVVHRPPEGPACGGPLLKVDDTMKALETLGRAARGRVGARVIAVTGSVGKTSTKEALRTVLQEQGETHASAGSLNNQWGAPLSLARMPRDATFGIFELGMNHSGELGPLSRAVRPHVALITNVEAVHLAHFASVEEIAAAKAEVFEGLEPGGTAVLNRDNPHFEFLARHARAAGAARVIGFGTHAQADVRAVKHVVHADCTCVEAEIGGQAITYKVGISGAHWVTNSLGVLATVWAAGGDLGVAGMALAGMTALKGRGRCHEIATPRGAFLVIDESYNASPVAVRAALRTLADAQLGRGGRRIAVLGDMLELGDEAAALHAGLAPDVKAAGVDLVFAAGRNMERLYRALPPEMHGEYAPDSAELLDAVIGTVHPGDAVLVKGSLGSRMGVIVDALLALGADGVRAARG